MKYFNSCLCCSFGTESIAIAVYAIIAGFLGIAGASMLFYYYDDELWEKYAHEIPQEKIIFSLFFTIIGQIVNILLLIGVLKRKASLMLPWLIIFGITIVLKYLDAILYLIWEEVLTGIGYLLGIALVYSMFHCILSYYKELQTKTLIDMRPDRELLRKY